MQIMLDDMLILHSKTAYYALLFTRHFDNSTLSGKILPVLYRIFITPV